MRELSNEIRVKYRSPAGHGQLRFAATGRILFSMSDLRGKVVLITGGSGGKGDALGRAFIAAECSVVLVARNQSRLKSAATYRVVRKSASWRRGLRNTGAMCRS